jgi:methionine synthase I (cobalamin-dependent)
MADLWNLSRPQDVEAIARAYIEAGSEVILTNTFRANPIALDTIGKAGQAAEISRAGAELSRKAAGSKARVFGSMGPTGQCLSRARPDARKVSDAFKLQTEALAEGGVHALVFETFGDVDEARLALRAARPTGLPMVVSFAFVTGQGSDRTSADTTVELVGRVMAEEGADAIGANCGPGPERCAELCGRLRKAADLPVWIKPSAGLPCLEAGRAIYKLTPEAFATYLPACIEAGASFVGGCCGTGPDFIRALRRAAVAYTDRTC